MRSRLGYRLTSSFAAAAALVGALATAPASAQSITEFSLPASNSAPFGIAAGPDGALWFTESGRNRIGRITTSGAIAEFAIPTPNALPRKIVSGPDGALWFGEEGGNRIGRIATDGTITEFIVPTANSIPVALTAGPDNNIWFVEFSGNAIGRLTPGGVFTEFPLPTANAVPEGITAGPDGNLWFAERNGTANKIGRITPDGAITEFAIPTSNSLTIDIVAGPDGNLWFGENAANKIGRITRNGTITEFPIPTASSGVWGLAAGPDGAIWFVAQNGNKIGRMTVGGTVTGQITIPTNVSNPFYIAAGADNRLWFTESNGNRIGRVNLALPPGPSLLAAALLPISRSVEVGTLATVFTTIINAGDGMLTGCRITVDPTNYVPGFFSYQTTDPATNALTGAPNTPATIAPHGLQTYVIAIRAGAPMPPADLRFTFVCDGVAAAAPISGVSNLQLVFDANPVADMIAVGLTPSNDGYAHISGSSGSGVFAVATTNLGPTTTLTARPRLSDSAMPLGAFVCETTAAAQCKAPPAPSVTLSVAQNATPTFTVFLPASGAIAPDPVNKRVFLEFLDGGGIVRGATSTAVTTQ